MKNFMKIVNKKMMKRLLTAGLTLAMIVPQFTYAKTDINNYKDSLVLYYSFDDGKAIDGSGLNNNGILAGTTLPVAVAGINNNVESFDGNGYIETADSISLDFGTGDFSIAFWIKTTKAYQTIFDKRGSNPSGYSEAGYHAMVYSGVPLLQINDPEKGLYNYYSTQTMRIDDGEWHYVAFSIDRDSITGVKTYIDGTLAAQYNATYRTGNISNTANLLFGKHKNGSIELKGSLDEFMIFNKAITSTEVSSLYTATQLTLPTPYAYWNFNDNLMDVTGNGNNITDERGYSPYTTGFLCKGFRPGVWCGTGGACVFDTTKLNIGTEDFSFSCWVKTPTSDDGWRQVYSKMKYYPVGENNIKIGYAVGFICGVPIIELGDSDGNYVNSYSGVGASIDDGQWHNVVFSVDRDQKIDTYVDGKFYETYTYFKAPGSLSNDLKTAFGIDACGCPNTVYRGDAIDEVKLFKKALTANEVVGLYNADLLAATQPCQN